MITAVLAEKFGFEDGGMAGSDNPWVAQIRDDFGKAVQVDDDEAWWCEKAALHLKDLWFNEDVKDAFLRWDPAVLRRMAWTTQIAPTVNVAGADGMGMEVASAEEAPDGGLICADCGRHFASERRKHVHAAMAHGRQYMIYLLVVTNACI